MGIVLYKCAVATALLILVSAQSCPASFDIIKKCRGTMSKSTCQKYHGVYSRKTKECVIDPIWEPSDSTTEFPTDLETPPQLSESTHCDEGFVYDNKTGKCHRNEIKAVYPDDNVLAPPHNVKVVSGGDPTFFTNPKNGSTLKHKVENGTDGILINLGRMYKLNHLVMELADGDKSYVIDSSEDNVIWTRIIDYSKYPCRSVQRLYFNLTVAWFIRVSGTSPADGIFEITRLEAYYTKEPLAFDPETNIIIPSENVALTEKNAIVIEGVYQNMLNDNLAEWSRNDISIYKNKPITMQLPQPYMLETINVRIYNDGFYNYLMEVSADKVHWTEVISEVNVNSLRRVKFSKQPVVFVRLYGTYKSNGAWFLVLQLEGPAISKS